MRSEFPGGKRLKEVPSLLSVVKIVLNESFKVNKHDNGLCEASKTNLSYLPRHRSGGPLTGVKRREDPVVRSEDSLRLLLWLGLHGTGTPEDITAHCRAPKPGYSLNIYLPLSPGPAWQCQHCARLVMVYVLPSFGSNVA
ncbi:hypothetical protein DPEC_G00308890 [Dallia pectoralis]|uniref:Uncharacterized protein n=1 Tax=Dallia pectoralis TaxID=75939 RepID=A0ACC2FES4_DALPE|nr:hypothetical protein DPEC_G00308890 [Dallia pectoralis]